MDISFGLLLFDLFWKEQLPEKLFPLYL